MTGTLEQILHEYAQALKNLLGDDLMGIYLTGSIALGAYHDGKSDIDFTTITKRPLNTDQTVSLKIIHRSLKKKYPHHILDGHYITPDELAKESNEIDPVIAHYRGRVSRSYHGINPVTWYTLRKYGVTVWGIPVKELILKAGEDELVRYVIDNVKTYWAHWLSGTNRFFSVKGLYALTPASIEWVVLGISRMYFTLAERDITSKDAVVAYMREFLPAQYQRILSEAERIRTDHGKKQYASPVVRRRDMNAYLQFMIEECNRLADQIPNKGGSSSM